MCVTFIGIGAEVRSMDGSNKLVAQFADVREILASAGSHDAGILKLSEMARTQPVAVPAAPAVAKAPVPTRPEVPVFSATTRHEIVVELEPPAAVHLPEPKYLLSADERRAIQADEILREIEKISLAEKPAARLPEPGEPSGTYPVKPAPAKKPRLYDILDDVPAKPSVLIPAKHVVAEPAAAATGPVFVLDMPAPSKESTITIQVTATGANVLTMQGAKIGHFNDATLADRPNHINMIKELADIARRQFTGTVPATDTVPCRTG